MKKQKYKILEELRRLYIKKTKVAIINKDLSLELHDKIEEFIGADINSFDLDFAVDTLNEGYGDLSFNDFIKQLRKLKTEIKK